MENTKMGRVKRQVYRIISPDKEGYLPSRIFDIFILSLIVVNVLLIVVDTFDALPEAVRQVTSGIEYVSIVIFTVEYALRVWTSDLLRAEMRPWKARLRYIFSFMALVDLLAILPFYLPFIFPIDLRVLRMIRLLRLVRLMKLNRYTTAISTIGSVMKRKAHQLLSSVAVVFILMLIASIIMYSLEHDAQPEAFENAFSGLWWAVATLTTVGYGDIYPITALGKLLSAVIALLGIGLVAVPTGIISAGFMEQIGEDEKEKPDDEKSYCPYCGKKIL